MNESANTPEVTVAAIDSAVEAKAKVVAAKVARTPDEIFKGSIDKIKSTGTPEVDNVAKTLLTKIWKNDLEMNSRIALDGAQEFAGEINKTEITVGKVSKGKTSRFVLKVGKLEITGGYAAKAFGYANGQHKTETVGGKMQEFDTEKVAEIAAIFGIES